MTNATLSQYDQQFAEAMALKLRLNREQPTNDAKVPAPSDTNEGLNGISESIVRESMEDFPGLTREKAMVMLEAAGG